MSFEITTAFVNEFKSTIEHLVQQKESRLEGAVRKEMQNAKTAFYDQLGKVVAQKRTTRHGDTPRIDTPHRRRAVSMADYEIADLIDRQDQLRMLTDPTSAYNQAFVAAMRRAKDEVLIAALGGTSYTGEDGTTAVTLPSTQKITASSKGFKVDKLKSALEILKENEAIDDGEDVYLVFNTAAETQLLKQDEIISFDYNTQRVLLSGNVDSFLGFKFIRTELINNLNGSTAADTKAYAFTRSGLLLATGEDINARITERDDKSYATQVYAAMTIGATRMQEEKVVEIGFDAQAAADLT